MMQRQATQSQPRLKRVSTPSREAPELLEQNRHHFHSTKTNVQSASNAHPGTFRVKHGLPGAMMKQHCFTMKTTMKTWSVLWHLHLWENFEVADAAQRGGHTMPELQRNNRTQLIQMKTKSNESTHVPKFRAGHWHRWSHQSPEEFQDDLLLFATWLHCYRYVTSYFPEEHGQSWKVSRKQGQQAPSNLHRPRRLSVSTFEFVSSKTLRERKIRPCFKRSQETC